jgi:hypothetical protein
MENVLLKGCIDVLNKKIIYDKKNSKIIINDFSNKLIFTFYGLLDKEKNNNQIIKNISEVQLFFDLKSDCFIIWDNEELPVIETVTEEVFNNLDDVLCVHYDTWLWIKEKEIVIEFNHNNEIVLFSLSNDLK